jgi:hypothetical protein
LDLLKESVSTERRKTKKKIAFWVLDPLSPRVDYTERRKPLEEKRKMSQIKIHQASRRASTEAEERHR